MSRFWGNQWPPLRSETSRAISLRFNGFIPLAAIFSAIFRSSRPSGDTLPPWPAPLVEVLIETRRLTSIF
jgi:hypothetical protein